MASFDNYGDLQASLGAWLFRAGDADLGAKAPDFIQLFEAEFVLNPDMRTLDMEVTATPTIAAAAVPLPAGFLEAIRIQVMNSPVGAPNQPLTYLTPAAAAVADANAQANNSALSGIAKNYTVIGGNIVITPQTWAPIGAQLEIIHYAFTPLSTATNGVNWLLQKYPNIYLYGSLMQAAAYIDDKDTVGFWQAGLAIALSNLNKSELKRKAAGGPLVMGPSAAFIA